jgi:hypothetical protein
MPEAGNQNPHHTLFAGSLFSLATLTGWGLIWLMLRERHLGGTIILPMPISVTASRLAAARAPWPIWVRSAAISTAWRVDVKPACSCRLSCLAAKSGRHF